MQLIKVVPRVSSSFADVETLFVYKKIYNKINEKEEYRFPLYDREPELLETRYTCNLEWTFERALEIGVQGNG